MVPQQGFWVVGGWQVAEVESRLADAGMPEAGGDDVIVSRRETRKRLGHDGDWLGHDAVRIPCILLPPGSHEAGRNTVCVDCRGPGIFRTGAEPFRSADQAAESLKQHLALSTW